MRALATVNGVFAAVVLAACSAPRALRDRADLNAADLNKDQQAFIASGERPWASPQRSARCAVLGTGLEIPWRGGTLQGPKPTPPPRPPGEPANPASQAPRSPQQQVQSLPRPTTQTPQRGPPGAGDVALQPYGGPGGGHHVPAKSAFAGAPGHNSNTALAIPNAELARLGVSHSAVTGAQMTGYRAFARTGAPLT